MSTSRKMPSSYNTSTYGSAGNGRDYTALATWEAATDNDLVTATNGEVLECYDDSSSFDDSVTLDGATTNSSYYRVVMPAAGEGHDGTPNNGVNFVSSSATIVFGMAEDYSRVHDLLVKTTASDSVIIGIKLENTGSCAVGCIVYGITTGTTSSTGFYLSDGICVNCLGTGIRGSTYAVTFWCAGDSSYYNCNAPDACQYGFYRDAGTAIAKNCIAENNTNNWAGTWTKTTCTDDDGVTFKDSSNDDYHLASGDTAAKDQGTDLSGDGTFAFNDDIDGDTRTGTWDIGFDEYVSGANVCFFGCNF